MNARTVRNAAGDQAGGRVPALLCIVLFFAGCATRVPPPIETGVIEKTLPDGPVRGRWAKVRLNHPAVEIVTTRPLAAERGYPAGTESLLTTVPKWAEAEGTQLAVNANFFAGVVTPAPGEKDPGWFAGRPVDLRGLSLSDGVVVSPPRVSAGQGDPAVVFYADGRARVARVEEKDLAGVTDAVAGIGPGGLLVAAGRNTGAEALVQPRVRHPRTAAGVTADGRTLILLVIDGRQPGHSLGATLPELADFMIELGAADAVNLDGGGSSTFIYRQPDGTLLKNQVPGGTWRPVGNHLGVRLKKK
jgi:exopolysaccharide biosynthesis protein